MQSVGADLAGHDKPASVGPEAGFKARFYWVSDTYLDAAGILGPFEARQSFCTRRFDVRSDAVSR